MLLLRIFLPAVGLLFSHTAVVIGQSFTQTHGGASAQDGIGCMATADGYLAGVRAHDPVALEHTGELYVLNGSGNLTGTNVLPLSNEVFLQAMANGPQGSAFLVGSLLTTAGAEHEGVIVKLNANGSPEWTTLFEGPASQQFFGAVALPDGGAIACGTTNINGTHDALVARFGADGTLVWSTTDPVATDADAYAVAVADGVVMVTGRRMTFGGTSDILLWRLDMDGNPIWTSSYGRSADEEGRAIIAQGPSTFIVAGWTNSFGRFDVSTGRIPDHAYLMAVDLEGDTLWAQAVGDTVFRHRAFALSNAPNGDLLVAGEQIDQGRSDALLIRRTASGAPIWERTIDTGKEERLLHLLPLADGMVATGWSFAEFGRQLLVVRRNADGF